MKPKIDLVLSELRSVFRRSRKSSDARDRGACAIGNPLDVYLAAIDRLAFKHGIADDLRRELVLEIAAHLDANIQARVETGETLAEASANARAAFGDPRKIVANLASVHAPRPQRISRPFLISLLVVQGLYSVNFARPGQMLSTIVGTATALAFIWFVVESFRVRRLQVFAFAAALVPVWLLITACLSISTVTLGGFASYPKSALPKAATEFSKFASEDRARISAVEAGYADFLREGGVLIPHDFDAATGRFRLVPASNHEVAALTWEFQVSNLAEAKRAAAQTQAMADEALGAEARPWLANIPGNLFPAASGTWLLFFASLLVHGPIVFGRWLIGFLRKEAARRRIGTRLASSTGASSESIVFSHPMDDADVSESAGGARC